MEYLNLIKPELLILVPFLYGIGYLLSKIPKMKDWSINILLTIISIAVTTGYMLAFNVEGTLYKTVIMALIQGVFIAMATISSEKIVEELIKKHSSNSSTDNIREKPEIKEGKEEPLEESSEKIDEE